MQNSEQVQEKKLLGEEKLQLLGEHQEGVAPQGEQQEELHLAEPPEGEDKLSLTFFIFFNSLFVLILLLLTCQDNFLLQVQVF